MAVRKVRSSGPVSYVLEDRLKVNPFVIGRPGWLEGAFAPGALPDRDKIIAFQNERDLLSVMEWLGQLQVLSADTETTGPDKEHIEPWLDASYITLFQIGNAQRQYLVEPELIPHFKKLLEGEQWLKVGHNLEYDFKWFLGRYGVHLVRMYCTMLVEQSLTAGLPGIKVNLADTIRRRLGILLSKQVRDEFLTFYYHPIFTPEMVYYGARDVLLLEPLLRKQVPELKRWKLEKISQLEFDVIPVIAEMELGGCFWDQEKHKLALKYFLRRADEIEARIPVLLRELRGSKKAKGLFADIEEVVNLRSSEQVLELFEELGYDLENIQRETLEEMARSSEGPVAELFELMAEYSNVTKVKGTYGDKLLDRVDPKTGLLHFRFFQMGSGEFDGSSHSDKDTVATGRMAGNAQQFPRPMRIYDPVVDPAELTLVWSLFGDRLRELGAVNQELIAV
jgi:DNA polymerase-1